MADDEVSTLRGIASLAIVVGGAFVVLSLFWTLAAGGIVQDGERGVYTRMGQVQGTVGPGFHPMIVGIDNIQKYEVRSQAYTMSSKSGEGNKKKRDDRINALTKEGLNVGVDMTVRYHVQPGEVGTIYEKVGNNEEKVTERIVRPTAREAIRGCSAQYSVEEIYSNKRDEFATCANDRIKRHYEEKGLSVEAVQIRNIELPKKVRLAIQKKQAAQERIQKKKKELKIEELEKKRKIIEAKGIAESNQIIGESLSREYLRWYFIHEGLEKGDPMYVPVGNDGMPIYKDVDKHPGNGDGNETG